MHLGKSKAIECTIKRYGSILYRTCLVYLTNESDAEDALQETFIRYLQKAPVFNDDEHKKAWLLRVATNICKDMLRFRLRHRALNIEDFQYYAGTDARNSEIIELVLTLAQKHKEVIILHYVEGYSVKDISQLLGISVSAAKKRLQYAREKLKLEFKKEEVE